MSLPPGVFLGILLILVSVLAGLGFRSLFGRTRAWPQLPGATKAIRSPQKKTDERAASAVAERIEEQVNRRLSRTPGLETTRVDFGTAEDGSLEIWIGERRFGSVAEIGDARVRQAIEAAVAAFNQ